MLAALVTPAFAVPPTGDKPNGKGTNTTHDLKHPLRIKQDALRQTALERRLAGDPAAQGKVVKVAKGQYVELAREDTDRVFVVIAEFGDTRHVAYPDTSPVTNALVFDGPQHNQIPEPDRSVDNSTLWQEDYDPAHYQNMYFTRMADYYESQSSGRYSIDGDVTEWVKVPFNEARYGRSGDVDNLDPAVCAGIVCSNTWFLIRDAMAFWVRDQLAAGKSLAEISDYLATFDERDRYDFDGDGNFDERDGYIDHFQIVHAGGDEAAGDPQQGVDAIWSHRWYTQVVPIGTAGPTVDGTTVPFGGVDAGMGGTSSGVAIPNNRTGVWVGDYTIQPENGGLGVFAHEYAHDLDLPDLYDTSGNVGGAENSTGFWTLMSSGANIGDGGPDGIGDQPTDLGAWEKFQLGWLGCGTCPGGRFYEVAFAGAKSEHKLGPNNTATKAAQALFVVLPPSSNPTTTNLGTPTSGDNAWYSTAGDNLDVNMTKEFSLPAGPLSLSMQAWYQIETCWDYAYLRVSTDGGANYTNLLTSVSDAADENGQNFGNGITGISGRAKVCDDAATTPSGFVPVTADLTPYAGQTIKLQIRYWTDGAVVGLGFEFDDLVISGPGGPIFTEDAESGDNGWLLNGFRRTAGAETRFDAHFYVAEYRNYRGYDTSLRTAYNFGFLNNRPDWVEHFPYQDGLLVSYWDTGMNDNGVGDHPGQGLILPVDAHPTFHHYYDGHLVRSRILSYDSTFGLDRTDAITIHKNSQPTTIASQPAVPVFDDTKTWWFNSDIHAATGSHVGRYQPGWVGVDVPKTGTTIRVKGTSAQGSFMEVQVAPVK